MGNPVHWQSQIVESANREKPNTAVVSHLLAKEKKKPKKLGGGVLLGPGGGV